MLPYLTLDNMHHLLNSQVSLDMGMLTEGSKELCREVDRTLEGQKYLQVSLKTISNLRTLGKCRLIMVKSFLLVTCKVMLHLAKYLVICHQGMFHL